MSANEAEDEPAAAAAAADATADAAAAEAGTGADAAAVVAAVSAMIVIVCSEGDSRARIVRRCCRLRVGWIDETALSSAPAAAAPLRVCLRCAPLRLVLAGVECECVQIFVRAVRRVLKF